MEVTNIMAEFSIYGEDILIDKVTEVLSLEPTLAYKRGDKIKGRNLTRKEDCWLISSGYEVSLDINNQLNKLLFLLKPKEQELKQLKAFYNVDYKFTIVINIVDDEKPAIYLESNLINFAHEISAEFDFDLYIY